MRLIPFLFLIACGGGDPTAPGTSSGTNGSGHLTDGNGLLATGEGPCAEASECAGDVCVALIDGDHPPVYCTQACDGGCPDGMFCDAELFALAGLDFCRFGTTAEEAAPPEEPPSLPCTDDSDCDGSQVCGTWMGEPGCTTVCTADENCWMDQFGISLHLAVCEPDEGAARDICVPDPDCFDGTLASFQSCVSYGF